MGGGVAGVVGVVWLAPAVNVGIIGIGGIWQRQQQISFFSFENSESSFAKFMREKQTRFFARSEAEKKLLQIFLRTCNIWHECGRISFVVSTSAVQI